MAQRQNLKIMMIVVTLFACAMIVLLGKGEQQLYWNSIALGILMVVFWLFELIPIYLTALFPILLGPSLGIISANDLAAQYGHRMVYLFFGGFVLSLALEKWDVHKKIAEGIIRIVGTSKSRILLGFMLATGLLSMWISNTATALMMLPMVGAVIHGIPIKKSSKFPMYLLLTVGYGASLGGMATLVGSPPNATMASLLETNYNIKIDFAEWMSYGLPLSIIMMTVTYFYFVLMLGKERKVKLDYEHPKKEKWTLEQKRVLIVFFVVVVLWTFRSLIVDISGITYKDEGPAILGAILLFVINGKPQSKLLEWKDMRKLPWGILILFGGGLALAKVLEVNGVVESLSSVFDSYISMGVFVLLLIMSAIAIFGTEVMSNLALVSVFVPVVATFALQHQFDVLQFCIPVTLAASCAFMLPVSTPPNAIVFSSGEIKIGDMAKIGFILNIVGVLLVSLFSYLFIQH